MIYVELKTTDSVILGMYDYVRREIETLIEASLYKWTELIEKTRHDLPPNP
jgi:hypothetical protein